MTSCKDCGSRRAEPGGNCLDCGAPTLRSADRRVTAPSALINANIRVGPLRFHRTISLISVLATLALVGFGGLIGWNGDSDASLAYVEDFGGLPTTLSQSYFDERMVILEIEACNSRYFQYGLVVGTNTIVAPADPVGLARAVQVHSTGIEPFRAEVVGLTKSRGLAVVRTNPSGDHFTESFVWATTTGLAKDETVYVVVLEGESDTSREASLQAQATQTEPPNFIAIEASLTSFRFGPDGLPTRIELSSETQDSFPYGSAVLDDSGKLVGVIDSTGVSFEAADGLRSRVSELVVNPHPPNLTC